MEITAIPFLDLSHQFEELSEAIEPVWLETLRSGRFVSGPRVEGFESAFAASHGVAHTVAVSNGTVALELVLRALGLDRNDEVIVPSNSFIATAEAVSNAGGAPVFVDVEAATGGISMSSVEAAIGSRTWGIVGVHLFGTPCDMDGLRRIADSHGLALIEDAAQAHLAGIGDRRVGGLGAAAAFSFYPGKNLGAPGEGGAVTTNDPGLASTLRALRDHGQHEKYLSSIVGTNARMNEMVAGTLEVKLPYLEGWNEERRRLASLYDRLLQGIDRVRPLDVPDSYQPARHLYPVVAEDRDRLRARLAQSGIGFGIHYPVPIHLQEAYSSLGGRPGDLPVAEQMAQSLLSLPLYPGLGEDQIERVAREIGVTYGHTP